MTSPRCRLNGARESRPAGPINLQENPSTTSAIRQTRLLRGRRNLQCVRGLGVFHGRLIRQLASEGEWPSGISKAVTAAGVLENGFSLSNYRAAKPIIESDRVEGTAVYDPSGNRIGTIRRLMIEKV